MKKINHNNQTLCTPTFTKQKQFRKFLKFVENHNPNICGQISKTLSQNQTVIKQNKIQNSKDSIYNFTRGSTIERKKKELHLKERRNTGFRSKCSKEKIQFKNPLPKLTNALNLTVYQSAFDYQNPQNLEKLQQMTKIESIALLQQSILHKLKVRKSKTRVSKRLLTQVNQGEYPQINILNEMKYKSKILSKQQKIWEQYSGWDEKNTQKIWQFTIDDAVSRQL